GGRYFKAPSPADLNAIYKAITVELNSQLILKYHSNTYIGHSYELVRLEVRYKTPSGQAMIDAISYTPPLVAVRPARSQPAPPNLLGSGTGAVELPPGLNPAAQGVSSSEYQVPSNGLSHSVLVGFGAALLAGFAALLG